MVGAAVEPTLLGRFEAHIDGKELSPMPSTNLVEIFGYIGECSALGRQKHTEPSSNSIITLVAMKRSLEILRMITSHEHQSVILSDH
jgi:hypothetical protein